MSDAEKIAAGLTPLQISAFIDCCNRGSTRANDGGLVDDLLSGLCSNTSEGVMNGWLVEWSHNHPRAADDHYVNKYTPTPLGLEVRAILTRSRPDGNQ